MKRNNYVIIFKQERYGLLDGVPLAPASLDSADSLCYILADRFERSTESA